MQDFVKYLFWVILWVMIFSAIFLAICEILLERWQEIKLQRSKKARKKVGGTWYYVQYVTGNSIESVINPTREWTQDDKPKGYYFEILETETHE